MREDGTKRERKKEIGKERPKKERRGEGVRRFSLSCFLCEKTLTETKKSKKPT